MPGLSPAPSLSPGSNTSQAFPITSLTPSSCCITGSCMEKMLQEEEDTRRKPQERSEAHDNSASRRQSHSQENNPFFLLLLPKCHPQTTLSTMVGVFWCECQARLGCRAQLTDTQPTRAPADGLQPAHPDLFSPQTTQHHTIPFHFGWTQPPKALSFISKSKMPGLSVIQYFSTKKRKKNPNPAAAFERSQEIASGKAQPGDGFL